VVFAVESAAFTCPGRDAVFYARGDGGEAVYYDIAGRRGRRLHFVCLGVGLWWVVEVRILCPVITGVFNS
jgi:hypothetical protein